MVSDFCFLSFNIFDIMSAFLSFIGEGYIMVGEKVIASICWQLFSLFLISDNFSGKAAMISISFFYYSRVKLAPVSVDFG